MDIIGLYRVSGSEKEVKILRDKFRKGVPNLNDFDIHVLCSCLKDFICMQKNHLIAASALSKLTEALDTNDVSESIRQVVLELPFSNRTTLAFLILHLKKYVIIKILIYFIIINYINFCFIELLVHQNVLWITIVLL